MSETFFPVNDLLRRRLQTGFVVLCLTLCTASTLFLFLLGDRIGFGILSATEGKLAGAFSVVFSQFILFVGLLNLVVAILVVSFMAHLMMSQRARDIGLIRAAGCPNSVVFSYFMNQLVIVAIAGCSLGVVLGLVVDLAATSAFSAFGVQTSSGVANMWLALPVFILFSVLSVVFGAKPVHDVIKVKPVDAISLSHAYGLHREGRFKAVRKSFLMLNIALRSMLRRKSATFRLTACLIVVFVLVTVSIGGGIIADETTKTWVEGAVGRDIVLIAHADMCSQYTLLLDVSGTHVGASFNYTDEKYLFSQELLDNLTAMQGIDRLDKRLMMAGHVKELKGVVYNQTTGQTETVGDERGGEAVVIGVDPVAVLTSWFVDGVFLESDVAREAVIGDSLAREMYTQPLIQKILCANDSFRIVGVCVDVTNNGRSTYVPLEVLQNDTGIRSVNIVLARISPESLGQLRANVAALRPGFEVSELNELLGRNLAFIGYVWSSIMLLPFFSLVLASLCLTSYVALAINEQRQELGVLRAVGAGPNAIVGMISWQSLVILVSAFGAGISIGTMLTLLVLIPEPLVSGFTVLRIAGWLLTCLIAVFGFSLYPALRFSRKPVLELMSQR